MLLQYKGILRRKNVKMALQQIFPSLLNFCRTFLDAVELFTMQTTDFCSRIQQVCADEISDQFAAFKRFRAEAAEHYGVA